jgi:hypothetical protein
VSATGELTEHPGRRAGVGRLAEDDAVDVDLGVAGEHELTVNRARLAERVLEHDRARIAIRQLLDIGRPDVELDPELLEDRLPLRRGGGED